MLIKDMWYIWSEFFVIFQNDLMKANIVYDFTSLSIVVQKLDGVGKSPSR